jgi:hypothetical protein
MPPISSIPDVPTFVVQPPSTPVSQFALRILVEATSIEPEPIGTAVWIAGHLALTAKHNIDYILREYCPTLTQKSTAETDSIAVRFYQVLPGPDYAIWELRTAWCSAESDLALLHLAPWGHTAKQSPDPAFGIRMKGLLPVPQSRIAGFGYHSSKTSITRHADGNYHLDLNDIPQATTGVVTAVFPDGRDRGMYPFPCFQVNAKFNSGMSGGPVFDETGHLIGVICGSLPAVANEDDVSYVAAIWPMFRILIDAKVANRPKPTDKYPAIDLALAGVLSVADLHLFNPRWFPGRWLPRAPLYRGL